MIENWKWITNYEGRYMISDFGRVKSFYRNKNGKLLKPDLHPKSLYPKYQLQKDGKVRHVSAHKLVAESFLEPVDGKTIVDHINQNRYDNHVSNLRWVSKSENSINSSKVRGESLYRGVSKKRNKWSASIKKDGITYRLGVYNKEKEASKAYESKAIELYGAELLNMTELHIA